jgi:hypothetical protein
MQPPSAEALRTARAQALGAADTGLWERADAANPNPSRFVPVQITGFSALHARRQAQLQAARDVASKLDESREGLRKLADERQVAVQLRLKHYAERQALLAHRVLRLCAARHPPHAARHATPSRPRAAGHAPCHHHHVPDTAHSGVRLSQCDRVASCCSHCARVAPRCSHPSCVARRAATSPLARSRLPPALPHRDVAATPRSSGSTRCAATTVSSLLSRPPSKHGSASSASSQPRWSLRTPPDSMTLRAHCSERRPACSARRTACPMPRTLDLAGLGLA